MKKIWNGWKKKWNIETDRRMIWIFVIFSITGNATLFVRKNLFSVLGIEIDNVVLSFFIKLVAIFFIYQVLLYIIGSILGEHKFVKWFVGKSLNRLRGKKK